MFEVKGLGYLWGLELRGLGFRVWGFGFGFWVQGLGCRASCFIVTRVMVILSH